jgi:hypothetical protein
LDGLPTLSARHGPRRKGCGGFIFPKNGKKRKKGKILLKFKKNIIKYYIKKLIKKAKNIKKINFIILFIYFIIFSLFYFIILKILFSRSK